MQFRFQLRYQLVRILHCSHSDADRFCAEGRVQVDGVVASSSRIPVANHQELRLGNAIIRPGIALKYLLFYKPNHYECTANRQVANHIYQWLPDAYQDLFPLGRLDTNSEGLLLLTNDGRAYRALMHAEPEVEKEYAVQTYQPVTEQLALAFTQPFLLGKRLTLPARFEKTEEYSFKVILKEGINRHIRRICAKCENQVARLVRTGFGKYRLGNLQPGQFTEVESFEV